MAVQKRFFFNVITIFVTTIGFQIFTGPTQCPCDTFVITSNKDTNRPGSLRHAIELLNQSNFKKPPFIYFLLDGDQMIKLKSPLPTIKKPVIIDGRSSCQKTIARAIALVGNKQVVAAITVDHSCAAECSFSNIDFHNIEFPGEATGIIVVDSSGKLRKDPIPLAFSHQEYYGTVDFSQYKVKKRKKSCCCGLFFR